MVELINVLDQLGILYTTKRLNQNEIVVTIMDDGEANLVDFIFDDPYVPHFNRVRQAN
jgi:hypothetical protein